MQRLTSKDYYRLVHDDVFECNRLMPVQEVRCNAKCRRAGIPTPTIFDVDMSALRITFEYIDGSSVKEFMLSAGIVSGYT